MSVQKTVGMPVDIKKLENHDPDFSKAVEDGVKTAAEYLEKRGLKVTFKLGQPGTAPNHHYLSIEKVNDQKISSSFLLYGPSPNLLKNDLGKNEAEALAKHFRNQIIRHVYAKKEVLAKKDSEKLSQDQDTIDKIVKNPDVTTDPKEGMRITILDIDEPGRTAQKKSNALKDALSENRINDWATGDKELIKSKEGQREARSFLSKNNAKLELFAKDSNAGRKVIANMARSLSWKEHWIFGGRSDSEEAKANQVAGILAKTATSKAEADEAYEIGIGDQGKAGVIVALVKENPTLGAARLAKVVEKRDSELLLAVDRMDRSAFDALDDKALTRLSNLYMSIPHKSATQQQVEDKNAFEKTTDYAEQLLMKRAQEGKLDIKAVAREDERLADRIIDKTAASGSKEYLAVLGARPEALEKMDTEELDRMYQAALQNPDDKDSKRLTANIRDIVSDRVRTDLIRNNTTKMAELSPVLIRDLVTLDNKFCKVLMKNVHGWTEGGHRNDFVKAAIAFFNSDLPGKKAFAQAITRHDSEYQEMVTRLKGNQAVDFVNGIQAGLNEVEKKEEVKKTEPSNQARIEAFGRVVQAAVEAAKERAPKQLGFALETKEQVVGKKEALQINVDLTKVGKDNKKDHISGAVLLTVLAEQANKLDTDKGCKELVEQFTTKILAYAKEHGTEKPVEKKEPVVTETQKRRQRNVRARTRDNKANLTTPSFNAAKMSDEKLQAEATKRQQALRTILAYPESFRGKAYKIDAWYGRMSKAAENISYAAYMAVHPKTTKLDEDQAWEFIYKAAEVARNKNPADRTPTQKAFLEIVDKTVAALAKDKQADAVVAKGDPKAIAKHFEAIFSSVPPEIAKETEKKTPRQHFDAVVNKAVEQAIKLAPDSKQLGFDIKLKQKIDKIGKADENALQVGLELVKVNKDKSEQDISPMLLLVANADQEKLLAKPAGREELAKTFAKEIIAHAKAHAPEQATAAQIAKAEKLLSGVNLNRVTKKTAESLLEAARAVGPQEAAKTLANKLRFVRFGGVAGKLAVTAEPRDARFIQSLLEVTIGEKGTVGESNKSQWANNFLGSFGRGDQGVQKFLQSKPRDGSVRLLANTLASSNTANLEIKAAALRGDLVKDAINGASFDGIKSKDAFVAKMVGAIHESERAWVAGLLKGKKDNPTVALIEKKVSATLGADKKVVSETMSAVQIALAGKQDISSPAPKTIEGLKDVATLRNENQTVAQIVAWVDKSHKEDPGILLAYANNQVKGGRKYLIEIAGDALPQALGTGTQFGASFKKNPIRDKVLVPLALTAEVPGTDNDKIEYWVGLMYDPTTISSVTTKLLDSGDADKAKLAKDIIAKNSSWKHVSGDKAAVSFLKADFDDLAGRASTTAGYEMIAGMWDTLDDGDTTDEKYTLMDKAAGALALRGPATESSFWIDRVGYRFSVQVDDQKAKGEALVRLIVKGDEDHKKAGVAILSKWIADNNWKPAAAAFEKHPDILKSLSDDDLLYIVGHMPKEYGRTHASKVQAPMAEAAQKILKENEAQPKPEASHNKANQDKVKTALQGMLGARTDATFVKHAESMVVGLAGLKDSATTTDYWATIDNTVKTLRDEESMTRVGQLVGVCLRDGHLEVAEDLIKADSFWQAFLSGQGQFYAFFGGVEQVDGAELSELSQATLEKIRKKLPARDKVIEGALAAKLLRENGIEKVIEEHLILYAVVVVPTDEMLDHVRELDPEAKSFSKQASALGGVAVSRDGSGKMKDLVTALNKSTNDADKKLLDALVEESVPIEQLLEEVRAK
ncbi:hypothetical protein ACFL6C_04305 [Myxococcota bacterium]